MTGIFTLKEKKQRKKLQDNQYHQRKREGLPNISQKSLDINGAMYVRKAFLDEEIWQAIYAKRPSITGFGITRAEAIAECERVLNEAIFNGD